LATPVKPVAAAPAKQGATNGHAKSGHNGHANGAPKAANGSPRELRVTFRRSGELERDMFRLRELYERIRDPRGRDTFVIAVESKGQLLMLRFPEDMCSINDRLTRELTKHFKVEIEIEAG
jgi:hypothetical protein